MTVRKIIFVPLAWVFNGLGWGFIFPGVFILAFADWLHDCQFEPRKREDQP